MKKTIVSLVVVLIVGLIHLGEDSLAVTQESEDKELRTLLESRRDVLKAVLQNQLALLHQGDAESPAYADMVIEVMNVDLELARTKDERIAIIEASLAMLVDREKYQEAKVNAALGSSSSLFIAQADRLKVEIELHKARKAP